MKYSVVLFASFFCGWLSVPFGRDCPAAGQGGGCRDLSGGTYAVTSSVFPASGQTGFLPSECRGVPLPNMRFRAVKNRFPLTKNATILKKHMFFDKKCI